MENALLVLGTALVLSSSSNYVQVPPYGVYNPYYNNPHVVDRYTYRRDYHGRYDHHCRDGRGISMRSRPTRTAVIYY
jgi:hypothetical protein